MGIAFTHNSVHTSLLVDWEDLAVELDAQRRGKHARSHENRLVQPFSEEALLKLAQASQHLGGSLGVTYVGDFLSLTHLENLLDVGRLVVDSHLEPGPVVLRRVLLSLVNTFLILSVGELLVHVGVARTPIVTHPDIVAIVDQL